MKCQNLFFGKNKKNISVCRLLKILPNMLSIKKMVHCQERPLLIFFFIPSEKDSALKRKKFAPRNSFCRRGLLCRKANRKS